MALSTIPRVDVPLPRTLRRARKSLPDPELVAEVMT
jgi:hypothetical protein